MLVCYEDEGVYVNTYGRITKDVVLQWGEMPTSVGRLTLPYLLQQFHPPNEMKVKKWETTIWVHTKKKKKKSVTNTVRLALSVWPQVLCPLFVLKMWTDAVSVAHLMFLMQFWKFLLTAYIHSNQIMGWGEKAIEIRSVETGHLDGVFMHKRAQRLKFLCERNDKVNPFQLCFSVCILRDLQVPVKPSFFLDAAESQLY